LTLVKEWLNVDAVQIRLQKIGVLKTAQIAGSFFQDFILHVKPIDLPALDQRLAFEPLANEHPKPKLFYLL
jgi:hypothetical protein